MSSVHRHTFCELVNQQGWTKGAELGVDKGILFGMLLRQCPQLHLIGVDTFPNRERSRRVPELAKEYAERTCVLDMTTNDASILVEDGSLDFVFIDADHTYEGARSDIGLWFHKVRAGGWVGGHDYSPKWPGVVQAVDESFGGRVRQWPGTIWGLFV